MNNTPLTLDFDFKQITVEQADYNDADPRTLANMAFEIFLIRQFENALLIHARFSHSVWVGIPIGVDLKIGQIW